MSNRKRKKTKNGGKPAQRHGKGQVSRTAVVLIVVGLAAAVVVWTYGIRKTGPDQAALSAAGNSKEKKTITSGKPKDFNKLIGRWVRPDGGYVIDIRGISPDGRMDAAYYNPRSIRVSRAEASLKKGAKQVFIELRDTGYPGSTYTLTYHPQHDILAGIYFQAAVGRSFEVVFLRAK
jgi:hypothetical protein